MSLRGPDDQDKTKLHGEINQYINQRFTISMTAITIFGVVIGWVVSGLTSPGTEPHVRPVTFLLAFILQVLLAILFLFSQALSAELRLIAAYLRVAGASGWEEDTSKFERSVFVGQKGVQSLLFIILGSFTGIVPFALIGLFKAEQDIQLGRFEMLLGMSTLFYIAFVGFGWAGIGLTFGRDFVSKWEDVKKAP